MCHCCTQKNIKNSSWWWNLKRWVFLTLKNSSRRAILFLDVFLAAGFGFFGGFWFYALLLLCFPAFLLLCFSAYLLFWFSAFHASLLLCFSALPGFFLFCFSAFPASLLFCFCASVHFYFFTILHVLFFSHVLLLLYFLLLCFSAPYLYGLLFSSVIVLYSLCFVT